MIVLTIPIYVIISIIVQFSMKGHYRQMNQSNKIHSRSARESIRNDIQLTQINLLRITTEMIRDLIQTDQQQVAAMKQELALIENGNLWIHHRKERFHYSCCDLDTGKVSGITGDLDRIHSLARRTFLENRIAAIEASTRRLDRVLQATEVLRYEERFRKKMKKYSHASLDLSRILFTKEQNEWIDAFYTPNPFHQENLKYPTNGGILMRSNSEAWFGTALEQVGLPYRFDDLVVIHNDHRTDRPHRDTYFADFKIPNLIGGITIPAHFGAFQLEQYADNALYRLNDYRSFSVSELPSRTVSPEEFTWSLEADLHDEKVFRRLIQRILLPRTY